MQNVIIPLNDSVLTQEIKIFFLKKNLNPLSNCLFVTSV